MDGLIAVHLRRAFLLQTRSSNGIRFTISPSTCPQCTRRTGRPFSQQSVLPISKSSGTRPRTSATAAEVPAAKHTDLLSTIWRRFKDFSFQRAMLGDLAVPIGYKRILQLKKRDGVPITAELVYTFSSEGLLRVIPVIANIGMVFLTYVLVKFYQKYRTFHLDPLRPAMTSEYSGNPMQFRTTEEYGAALVFTLVVTVLLNVCCNRGVARCYYDKTKDLFTLVTYNAIGRPVATVTKPDTVRELDLHPSSFRQFFGNCRVVDENGKSKGRFFLRDHNFSMPWYYNRLTGAPQGNEISETVVENPITEEDLQMGAEHVAAKLAKANAVKMESYRKSQVDDQKPFI